MEWSDYLEKLIEDENDFDGITLSLDGGASVIAVPPIIRASVLMLDKMLENQGKRQIIVFPERNQSTFIFSIAYLLHNIIDGKIKQKYEPHSFAPGEKLKIGNAVVEFVCFEFHEGKEYIKIRLGDNSTVSMALTKAPILQKTDTSRKLSPYKTYPICIQSAGQGPESLNLAACHNCALLPETCCEHGNRLLDRGVVVGTLADNDIGFFSELRDI